MSLKLSIYYFVALCGLILLLDACAVQQDPLGGIKDEIPPYPDSIKSTPNRQLFFEKQNINLVFNEWIKIKNSNQIIVSPPLEFGVEAKMKGKSVVLSFDNDELLKENTTYTINLGESIVDYTEGNPMTNYTHVFSTGAFIDSMAISGTLIDVLTAEPMENIIVSLYDNLVDSAFYKERPLYFTRTDEKGFYEIKNVRIDTFRVFAIEDKNLNYFKDKENEAIAFRFDSIVLDSVITNYKLELFLPEPVLRAMNKEHEYGTIAIAFNRDPYDIQYRIEPITENLMTHVSKDSMFWWYNNDVERSLIIDYSEEKHDTIPLLVYSDSLKFGKKVRLVDYNASGKKGLSPVDTLKLSFERPIVDFDESLFEMKDTSDTPVPISITINNTDPRILNIRKTWIEGEKHKLVLYPNAVKDFLGTTNDTIKHKFVSSKLSSLGEIVFELDSLNQDYHYIVEISKGKKKYIKTIRNQTKEKLSFHSLSSGKYLAKIYEDRNQNGRWDPGDYFLQMQSEKWLTKELETLKANWTLEVSVNGKEFK